MHNEHDANQALADMLERFQNVETFRKDFAAEEAQMKVEYDRVRQMNKVLDVIFGERAE